MTKPDGTPELYKVKKGDTERIQSLEELLKALDTTDESERKTWLHLEFHGKDEEMIKEANRLLKQYNRHESTLWGHTDDSMIETLKKVNYSMPRVASPGEVESMFIKYWLFAYPYILPRQRHYIAIWFPLVNENYKANLR